MIRSAATTLSAGDGTVTLELTSLGDPISTAAIFLANTSSNTAVWKVQGRPAGQSTYVNIGWVDLNSLSVQSGGNFAASNATDYAIVIPNVGMFDAVRLYLVSISSGSYLGTVYGLTEQEARDMNFPVSIVNAATAQTITSTSATAFSVGRQGSTNPVLNVNANTGSVVTGITIVGAATGGGVAITATDSGTDTALILNAKGTGGISLNATATGTVTIGSSLTFADAKNIVFNATTGTKIGTATTQKLAFYNSTPITQPAANTDTTTGAAGGTTAIYLNTTFTGAGGTAAFTVGGVITQLKALGLLAA